MSTASLSRSFLIGAISILVGVVLARSVPGAASNETTIATIDHVRVAHYSTDLVLDSFGYPVVSYYDAINEDLKVLHCGNASCTSGNSIATPDAAGDVGRASSIVLDSVGNPVVSYTGSDALKILHCGNPSCTSGNSIATPETSISFSREYTSIDLDDSGNPVVAYHEAKDAEPPPPFDTQSLKVLHCGNPNCTSGNSIVAVDEVGYPGVYNSMRIDQGGNPVVAYSELLNQDLKILRCGNPTCTSANTITAADTSGEVGEWPSLALDALGNPVVAYRDLDNIAVKILHCGNADCTSGNSIERLAVGSSGTWISLDLDSSGNPVVAYYDVHFDAPDDGALRVLHCGDPNCATSNVFAVPDSDDAYYGGMSLVLDADGYPVVSYIEAPIENWLGYLTVLHCSDANCSKAEPTAAPTGTPTPITTDPLLGAAHLGPDGPSTLYRIDTSTGSATIVGPIGFERVSAMDFDSGTLFATGERSDGSDTNVLITIDPTTGVGSEVGPTGIESLGFDTITDMSFRPTDGTLFGYLVPAGLGTINPLTGGLSLIGEGSGWSGNGIAFEPGPGEPFPGDPLWHGTDGPLSLIDQATGASWYVADLTFPPPADSDPRINAMDYGESVLYASLNNGYGGSPENYLAVIDSFFDVTIIGETADGLDALSFVPAGSLPPIPTPTPCPTAGCPTPTNTATATDTPTPTSTATPRPDPFFDGELSLSIVGASSCDVPSKPSACEVPAGSAFTLEVDVHSAPAAGYVGLVSRVEYGSLVYSPAPEPGDEISLPDGLEEPVREPVSPTGFEGWVLHLDISESLSSYVGGVVSLGLQCPPSASSFEIVLPVASDLPAGFFIDDYGVVLPIPVGSRLLDLDGDTIPELVPIADVLIVNCVDEPGLTPTPTSVPATATPTSSTPMATPTPTPSASPSPTPTPSSPPGDISGVWNMTLEGIVFGDCVFLIDQTTSNLTVEGTCAIGLSLSELSGSIDTGTGAFTVSGTALLGGVPFCTFLLTGIVSADASSLSGDWACLLGGPMSGAPDTDSDGVHTDVDLSPVAFSESFSDVALGGMTVGTIIDRSGLTVMVVDLQDVGGVRIKTVGGGGLAEIQACTNPPITYLLSSGDELDVTCGSASTSVIVGPVSARMGTMIATLPAGSVATVAEPVLGTIDVVNDPASDAAINVGGAWLMPGQTAVALSDTDGDGLEDSVETAGPTNPFDPDSDDDDLGDGMELLVYHTDPLISDTDSDGCQDGAELGDDEKLGGLREPLNSWDFYDVAIGGGAPGQDGYIDLFNDISGVIDHYGPTGTEPAYDVNFDRGPAAGPNEWNMTAPDGRIDLFNDIAGVIAQFGHDCR